MSADTKPDFAESSVSAIAIPSPVYDFPAIAILWEGTPHNSELSRDDLQATPYEINHETRLGGRFLDGTSDVNLSECEKVVPFMTQPVISPASIFRRSRAAIRGVHGILKLSVSD